jgi:hypothetical protein
LSSAASPSITITSTSTPPPLDACHCGSFQQGTTHGEQPMLNLDTSGRTDLGCQLVHQCCLCPSQRGIGTASRVGLTATIST